MMKTVFKLTLLASIALPAQAAMAQDKDDTGFYVGANFGVANLGDAEVGYYEDEDTLDFEYDAKSAATFGGVIGYDFGPVRADIEVAYSRHKLKSLTFKGLNGEAVTLDDEDRADVCDFLEADSCGGSGNSFAISGSRIRQLSGMANVWADIPVGSRITPYVGGGLGISGFEVDGEGKGKFAWQLGAGAGFKLTDAIELTADYRHREVGKTNVVWDATSGVRVGKLKTDSFTAGLRVRF